MQLLTFPKIFSFSNYHCCYSSKVKQKDTFFFWAIIAMAMNRPFTCQVNAWPFARLAIVSFYLLQPITIPSINKVLLLFYTLLKKGKN